MKLLLHIGTHKTATTSIQRFCAHNRKLLKKKGIFYPRDDQHFSSFNNLAALCAKKHDTESEEYFERVYILAKQKDCDTVLISSEMFFGMTTMFYDIRRRERSEDYWEHENKLIEKIALFTNSYTERNIICFLRPQASYAESLYLQMLKGDTYLPNSFQEFTHKIWPILEYDKQIQTWARNFTEDAIKLFSFESAKNDPVEFFCKHVFAMGTNGERQYHFNKRLNHDVLVAKKSFLKDLTPEQKENRAYISQIHKSYKTISKKYGDGAKYLLDTKQFYHDTFGALDHRNNQLFQKHRPADKLLSLSGISDLEEYPGLDEKTLTKINEEAQRLLNRSTYKAMRFIKGNINKAEGFSFLKPIVQILRIANRGVKNMRRAT